MTDWWHHFAGPAGPNRTLWAAVTIGPSPEGPDGQRTDGAPITDPFEYPGLDAELPHLGSWDHKPTRCEVIAVTPLEWHDDDCPCGADHPDEAV